MEKLNKNRGRELRYRTPDVFGIGRRIIPKNYAVSIKTIGPVDNDIRCRMAKVTERPNFISGGQKMIKYRYCRDNQNRPLITVCETYVDGKRLRGIAICSPLDNPCKSDGRKIAFKRARAAGFRNENGQPIFRGEALQVLQACGAEYEFKSEVL